MSNPPKKWWRIRCTIPPSSHPPMAPMAPWAPWHPGLALLHISDQIRSLEPHRLGARALQDVLQVLLADRLQKLAPVPQEPGHVEGGMEGWNEVSYASLSWYCHLLSSCFFFGLTCHENSRMFPVFLLMCVFCLLKTQQKWRSYPVTLRQSTLKHEKQTHPFMKDNCP